MDNLKMDNLKIDVNKLKAFLKDLEVKHKTKVLLILDSSGLCLLRALDKPDQISIKNWNPIESMEEFLVYEEDSHDS